MCIVEVVQGDITKLKVDAIVNAANTSLLGGGGVDGAIHRAAGQELLEECRGLGGCPTGQAKITKGYQLKARYVIHTVGPVWHGGANQEGELLKSCYFSSLELARQHKLHTLAFPCISTGVYRFPKLLAAEIALKNVYEYISQHKCFRKIIFVCFDQQNYLIYQNTLTKNKLNLGPEYK